jgi:GDP-4-dehydro-6-deoxy-D-mannose reductase
MSLPSLDLLTSALVESSMPNQPGATVLITGGTGFAGSHLIEHLLSVDPSAAAGIHTTHYADIPDYLARLLPVENFHRADLTDVTTCDQLFTTLQPQKLYHLAAFASVGNSFEKSRAAVLNNMGLQLNVLESIQKHSPKTRMLLIGSADGYGISENETELPISEDHPFRPVNPYGVSKVAQELLGYAYAKSWQLDIVRVRPFNHIGERQTEDFAVASFAKQIVAIERGEQSVLKVGNLDAVRDFTDVKDMVKAYHLLMEQGQSGEVYNAGSGVGTTMSEVVHVLSSQATTHIELQKDETRIRALDIPVIIANNEKLQQLGWQPHIPLDQSLQRVLEYWRTQ